VRLCFLSCNRYVDLTEAIESNDPTFLDNSEFQDTDAVPLNGPLPSTQYLRDEVLNIPFVRVGSI
jgi:hypothetical protein